MVWLWKIDLGTRGKFKVRKKKKHKIKNEQNCR